MANLAYTSMKGLTDLLREADPQTKTHVWVLSFTELAVGSEPGNPQKIIDLSMETVRKFADNTCQSHNVLSPSSSGKFSRQTGSHWLQFRGDRRECRSLKHLLAESLLAFEDAKPGTLTSLSRVKGRTKRIVAREPSQLFKSPELAEKYSEPLGNGWYFGTNNSALETRTWLKRAAACAGLKPGADFTTSLD